MKKETVKLNKAAMKLTEENCFASFKSEKEGSDPKLEILAYSGGIIKDHWWWGNLAIDLNGMSFPKKKMPILEDHNTSKKIGFATKMSIDNNQLTVAESSFIDTPESLAFRKNSSEGFPYEASIYAQPTTIERVGEGDTAEVNGYTFKGPGTIWRKSTFKEVSVCTFGYDPNTKSAAMSEGEEEISIEYSEDSESTKFTNEEESTSMNREKFKTEHSAEYDLLVAEITKGLETKFSSEKEALEVKLAQVEGENTKLSQENKDCEKRLFALEKESAIRAEKELESAANATFTEKFSESGLPDRLSAKIRKLVNHDKFVADGKLDTEAFSAAVEAELKDWSNEVGSEVNGFSTSSKGFGNADNSKVTDDIVTRMLGHVGQSAE